MNKGPAALEASGASGNRQLPFSFAKRHGVVVTDIEGGCARIVHKAGVSVRTLVELRRHFGMPLELQSMDPESFSRFLTAAYERQSDNTDQIVEDLGEALDLSRVASELQEPGDLLDNADDAPIIRLINALLAQAIRENASDIHIEPFESRLVVRLRIDGVLREILQPNRALAPFLVSRVKVMAKLDIAEKRLPQDGRMSLRIAGRPVDVRVATIPSGHGERVVLRLLNKEQGRLDLARLGMLPKSLAALTDLISRPHGIVLVTGPTGSGKTTTLYAILDGLNDRSRNIMTVEEPIEYYLDGIAQTQVNQKVDMSFARGLRAILRQDPDVVMVGEIRDIETAEIAVRASLTGHLVLSTLHTNTAAGAVTRLSDMGIESFLLSSSLLGVVAQRLVRVLCGHCKHGYAAPQEQCALLGVPAADPPTLFQATGCRECGDTGYRGRTGIFELLVMDDVMRKLVHDGAGEFELQAHARRTMPGIHEDGVRKVLSGDTSVDELLRVTRWD